MHVWAKECWKLPSYLHAINFHCAHFCLIIRKMSLVKYKYYFKISDYLGTNILQNRPTDTQSDVLYSIMALKNLLLLIITDFELHYYLIWSVLVFASVWQPPSSDFLSIKSGSRDNCVSIPFGTGEAECCGPIRAYFVKIVCLCSYESRWWEHWSQTESCIGKSLSLIKNSSNGRDCLNDSLKFLLCALDWQIFIPNNSFVHWTH